MLPLCRTTRPSVWRDADRSSILVNGTTRSPSIRNIFAGWCSTSTTPKMAPVAPLSINCCRDSANSFGFRRGDVGWISVKTSLTVVLRLSEWSAWRIADSIGVLSCASSLGRTTISTPRSRAIFWTETSSLVTTTRVISGTESAVSIASWTRLLLPISATFLPPYQLIFMRW